MKEIILCIMLAFAGISCSKQAEESSSLNIGEGRMAILLDTQSAITATTRSGDTYELPEAVIPSEEDFSIAITGSYIDATTLETKSYSYSYESLEAYNTAEEMAGGVKTPPFMPAGNYTATISNKGDESIENSTNACFAGSVDFTIEARITDGTATIMAKLQNSVVRVQTTTDFDSYFSGGATLILSTESGTTLTYSVPNEATEDEILFVSPGTTLYLEGSGVKDAPTENESSAPTVTFAKAAIGTAAAGEMSTVVVDAEEAGGTVLNITLDDTITSVTEQKTELND